MRRILALPVTLILVGCTLIVGPTPTVPSSPTLSTTTTTSTSSTTTTTVPTTTTTEYDPGPVLGLITPTGVPVVVNRVLDDGYEVYDTCGELTMVSGGEPLHRTPVVLDPGHGGRSSIGAQGRNGLPEKEINLTLSFEVQRVLALRGIPSVLARVDDYGVTISSRARLADALQSEALVSVHHNAPAPAASPTPGTEVYHQSTSEKSRRLAGLLFQYVFEALQQFDVAWTAAPDAGAFTVLNRQGLDTYGILRLPTTPSALLEVGYINNPAEAELFATAEYVKVIGVAIADAIEAYLTTEEPGSGWTEGRTFTAQAGLSPDRCDAPDLE